MVINKINPANFSINNQKSAQNTDFATNPVQIKLQISDSQSISRPYSVSFGIKSENSKKEVDFAQSVNKFFRLKPDKYQTESAKHIFNGDDVLVLAPTGTGKTLIAEYAINKNLAQGKTTFYTTPLKALSNEKYTDFCKLFGKENVGLMTGEIKVNPQAPVVIMTTEIYRNMLVGENEENLADRLENVATVIYDEFHYMNEPERGEVWETSIMYTPQNVQQLLLSATAENGSVVQKWMNRLLDEKGAERLAQIVSVPSDERHVPLKFYVFDEKRVNSVVPLTKESYNLQRLGKALNPASKRNLTDKQKEVLAEISLKLNNLHIKDSKIAEPSVEDGLAFLMKRLNPTGGLSAIENLLVEKLGYSKPEAERVAAILADKNERKLNDSLIQKNKERNKEIKELSKADKKEFFQQNGPKRVISPYRLSRIIANNGQRCNHDEVRALKQLSRLTGGDTSVEDGLMKLAAVLQDNELKVKEFEKKLAALKLNERHVKPLVDMLMVLKKPAKRPAEFDLIKALDSEDKLPAIFFRFSKKQCDDLRKKFLKTENGLLNPEEKAKAEEIIKKHAEKDSFFGTDEDIMTLLSGVAVHHAGKMPGYKALVEELAQNKLLKVVFATSTLGAGINVPAKTVVFTQLTRFAGANGAQNGEKFVDLTPNEFQQMGGRAGRRGKDFIGNVVVMPDKEHGAQSIFNLATAKSDPITSSFKPTYSFITHYISQNGTTEKIADAVEKSFLQERLESLGVKPYKVKNKIKKEFSAMANVITDEKLGCFEKKDDYWVPTIKGDMVAKARGVDGLIFAQTICSGGLEYLTAPEMAAVACALTPADERDAAKPVNLSQMAADVLWGIDSMNKKLEDLESSYGLNRQKIILNRTDAQNIQNWADAIEAEERMSDGEPIDSISVWEKLINQKKLQNPAFSEGEMFKSINNTVDILEQIKETSAFAQHEYSYSGDFEKSEKMKKIKNIAADALKLIKKDPITYEL